MFFASSLPYLRKPYLTLPYPSLAYRSLAPKGVPKCNFATWEVLALFLLFLNDSSWFSRLWAPLRMLLGGSWLHRRGQQRCPEAKAHVNTISMFLGRIFFQLSNCNMRRSLSLKQAGRQTLAWQVTGPGQIASLRAAGPKKVILFSFQIWRQVQVHSCRAHQRSWCERR